MTDRRAEAAAWLGLDRNDEGKAIAAGLPGRIVEAIASDDLGPVPPEFAALPAWDGLSDHDREQLLIFGRFLGAIGPPRIPLIEPETETPAPKGAAV